MKKTTPPSLKRLQLFIIMALGLAILVMGGIWITYNHITLEQQAERLYSIQADMIGSATKPAMMFADKKLATELINQLRTNGDISAIQLFTADGKLLAGFPDIAAESKTDHSGHIFSQEVWFENNHLKLKRTVLHKQVPVGMIYVEFDLTELTGHKRTDIINIIFIITGVLLLSILVVTRLQRKLTNSESKLHLAVRQAESANQAKSDFLSTMSHELRTPIHGIIGLQRLISDDTENLSHEQRENLLLAQQSAKSLRALVNDILDLAKIESGNIELVKTRFKLQNCICDALIPFRVHALEKGVLLSLHIKNTPKTIISDESRLRQILLNLIGNAMKFTHQGEVSVHVTEKSNQLEFIIKDSGIGIAKEDLKHVFEPFVQSSKELELQQLGTGLGTSIVKRFVELMGGSIRVESKLGEGSCFTFSIPCYPDGNETISCDIDSTTELFHASPEAGKEERTDHQSTTLRVLLAEDDPIGQRIASKQLTKAGIEVHIVDNGELAWEKMQNHSYDLLLTDIRMPLIDGIELTRKIRALEKKSNSPRLPIIGLSAHALEEVANECIEAGMDHFMAKPVDPEKILSAILKSTSRNKN
ncbi:MAG: ATP-binding protein [Mariprofundaceae bacterium]